MRKTWDDYGYQASPKGTLTYVVFVDNSIPGSTSAETLYFPTEVEIRQTARRYRLDEDYMMRIIEGLLPETYSLVIDIPRFRQTCEEWLNA